MRKRRLLGAFGAVVVAVASAAATTAGASAQLTKPQYIAKGDAICTTAIVRLGRLGRLYPAARAAANGDKWLAIDRRTLAALRALTPPADDRAAVSRMLGLANVAINQGIVGVVAAARSGNAAYMAAARRAQSLIDTAHAAARAYGFSSCARW